MSIYAFPIDTCDQSYSPLTWTDVFDDKLIDSIKEQSVGISKYTGSVVTSATEHKDNKSIRNVQCHTLEVNQFQQLYDKLMGYVLEANEYFKYNLIGFMEPIQFLHYGEDIGGGHYNWHMDCGPGISTRKLTIIVQLSDPIEYVGCDTEIMFSPNVSKEKGSITIFPSWMPHRVTQLESGNRDALVVWVNGPPFS